MGTQRPQDLLLIEILRKIESRISSSFCDLVYAWEITTSSSLANFLATESEESDGDNALGGSKKKRKMEELEDILVGGETETDDLEGVTPLFTVGRSGFEVTFDGGLIQNSIRNFDTSVKFDSRHDKKESYGQFLLKMKHYSRLLRSEMTYSTEFFLLLVTSSNLLTQHESSLIVENLRAFVESGVLALVLCSLSHTDEHINKLALSLLVATANGASPEMGGGFNGSYQDRELVTLIANKIFSYITTSEKKNWPMSLLQV